MNSRRHPRGGNTHERTRVLVIQEYVPEYRAAFFQLLREKLEGQNIQLDIAHGLPSSEQAVRGDAATVKDSILIKQWQRRIAGRRLTVRRLPRLRGRYDVVVLEQARRNLDLYLLVVLKRLLGQNYPEILLWGHGVDYTHTASKGSQRLLRQISSHSQGVLCYTCGGASALREQGVKVPLYVLANALPGPLTTVCRPATEGKVPNLLYVGALEPVKRMARLLEAVQALHEQGLEFSLTIAGSGSLEGAVNDWCSRRPWAHAVGYVSGEDKDRLLREADVIVNPGRVGLIAVDSLNYGLPIVTIEGLHAPEIEYLRENKTYLIASDSPGDFEGTLGTLIRDPQRLAKMQHDCLSDAPSVSLDTMVGNFASAVCNTITSTQSP